MSSIKRHKVLYNDSAAGTGDWVRLDSRYDKESNRIIQAFVTTGDTLTLQGITLDSKTLSQADLLDTVTAADITDIKEYTESNAGDDLSGPWTYIRATKTGTAGTGKVQGFV